MRRSIEGPWNLAIREAVFRAICRHRQGEAPNILLHCMPRSGSTWILNTVAAHPGTRYIGRPFMTALRSRWRRHIPDLAQTAGAGRNHHFANFIHFEGDALARFDTFARSIVQAERHIYPTLHYRAPYFHRHTNRVILQVHSITTMIEWFDASFPVRTMLLLRHPIANGLSVLACGWRDEAEDFIAHDWFTGNHLTGAQVDLSRSVLADGSPLARQVLDWCLRMLVPLRAAASGTHPDWLVLTYEETVLEPERVVHRLSGRLDLPDVDAMLEQVRRPSRNVTPGTVDRIADHNYLLTRWRSKIGKDEERALMQIPAAFDIDVYRPGHDTPDDRSLPSS